MQQTNKTVADETKLCTNCKRDISTTNFVMHEMHCRRHIVLCEHCNEPVHRSEIEQHFSDIHAKIACEKCQQLVPRSDMAKHLTEECTKKLMKCEFCEISLPKNELEGHLDYCGSRTECCPLCKQYIMQKDKLRHESSQCTYPEARPQPLVDPFSMGDLQQFMTSAVLGVRNSTNSTFRKGQIPASRKSDLNAQIAKNILIPEVPPDVSVSSLLPDVDYDSMLALQLAHEDWLQDGEIENDGEGWGYAPYNQEQISPVLNDFGAFLDGNSGQWSFLTPLQKLEPTVLESQTANEEDENMSIPCEFCDEKVPLNFFIVHMESCPLALQRREADLNNEHAPVQQSTIKPAIPVINNLRPSSPPPPGYFTISDDDDDDVMLPCEFCQEIFPSDLIIQHQSVCQADGVVTPRAVTPIRTCKIVKPQQPSSHTSFKPTSRSPPKRQKNPAEVEFVSEEDNGELAKEDLSNVWVPKINESSSNKYSPAYNRFDEALTRPPRRSTRQQSLSSDEATETKSESRSSRRTRASLNQLLQEDASPEVVNLADHRKELGILKSHDINRSDPRDRRTKVDSRTVTRQLEENRRKPVQARPSLPQNGSTYTRSSQISSVRNRQRADHVFSPELRLKPNNSPPPKKR